MSDVQGDAPLVPIRLEQLPLRVLARAQEHGDGLTREFALIATSMSSDSVPLRLQQLSEQLRSQYATYTEDTQRQIDEALDRGDQTIDAMFKVPTTVVDACLVLNRMLDEADDFCRSGDLLTLATPDDLVRFRRWYLGEFVRQVNGGAPVPWPHYGDDWPPSNQE